MTSIAEAAFQRCSGLTSLTIPNSVTSIGNWAFSSCTGLTSVTVNGSITHGAITPFSNCTNIEEVFFDCEIVASLFGNNNFGYNTDIQFNLPGIKKVTLSEKVKTIDKKAFSGCSGLTSITIPQSVTSIGESAFSYCTGLTSVTIPNSVTSISEEAFYSCTGLTSVTIPNSVTTIGNSAFYSCTGLTSVTIPNSVTSIGNSAFWECTSLTSVTIPNSVTTIGDYAFNNCRGLATIVSEIKTPFAIGDIGNNSATLIVPAGTKATYQSTARWSYFTKIVEVGEGGVVGSKFEIDGIYYAIGENNTTSPTPVNNAISGALVIPSQVEFNGKKYDVISIDKSAFSGCSGLTSVIIPNSVTSIGQYAFQHCSGLTSVTVNGSLTTIGSSPFYGCNNIEEVSFDCETVTSLFSYFSGIKKVTLSENVKTISNSAFSGCSGLTSVTIPSSVTSIGDYAFSGCSGLTSVTIPSSVTSIGNFVFSGCSGLTSVTIPSSLTSISEGAFSGCSDLTSVTIPNSVTSIGYQAFSGCSGLTSIIIGSGVLAIGSDAFNYTNLKKTIWLTNTPPSGYKKASGAVNYVSNDQFDISNKVVYKSLSSYFDVDGIRYVPVSPSERTCDAIDCVYDESAENLVISSTVAYKGVTMNVKNLNKYLAYNNKHIKTLVIDIDGEVSDYAFANCSNIKSVTLGQKVSAIGSWAFQGCSSFETINIPDIVTALNEGTFSGCTSLKEINIKPQMTSINDYAFENCTSLAKVTISDSESTLILGSNVYSNSKPIFSSCPLDYVYIGRDISYKISSSYGYSPFYRNTTLREVKITDKETEISENEFYGCTNLQTVTIGDGVTTIGNWAFSGCQSLEYFTFGTQVETIGQDAFSDCTALVQITSRAKKAPACGSQALDDINKWECKLIVPQGYLSVYQEADQWKDFWFTEEGEYIPPKKGDVNSDGKVDQYDLRDLVEYIMGNKPNGVTVGSADVNEDNKVNIADVVTLTPLLK